MARTIAIIKTSILAQINANLPSLTSTSAVAIYNLMAYIVAVCQWTLETLFDSHVSEVQGILSTMKPHTLQWYVTMAKTFQYGCDLLPDSDQYDNSSLTQAQVTASQVVNSAAVLEDNAQHALRVKAATLTGTTLGPLSTPQLTAFAAYMNQVRDAGVRLNITSGNADSLQLGLGIFYDPLILDNNGERLDGTENTPVQDAIVAFIDNLPFNGLFVLNELGTALQQVDGVLICQVNNAAAHEYGTGIPWINIMVPGQPYEYTPDAGYMTIDTASDLTLTFTPHTPI